MTSAHAHAEASTRCASAKPNRLIATSASAGWRSLMLDHHEGLGRSEAFDTHPTEDLTLVVATSGRHELEVFSGGRWRSALYQPGAAGLTAPGASARLRWRASGPEPFRTAHIYLPATLLEAVADEYRRAGQPSAPRLDSLAFRDEALLAQAKALLAAFRGGEPDLYAAGAAIWLATHLLSRRSPWREATEDERSPPALSDRRLARALEFMTAQIEADLSLADLAREAGISVHHFGRRFRERMGVGPAAYLAILRMERARLLLRTTELTVGEVARRCGYGEAAAFSTAFRRHVGASPRAFRSRT